MGLSVIDYKLSFGEFTCPQVVNVMNLSGKNCWLPIPAVPILDKECVLPPFQLEKADVSPEGAPGVANIPVLQAILFAPANHLHVMVDVLNGGVAVVPPNPRPIAVTALRSRQRIINAYTPAFLHKKPGKKP